MAVHKKIEWDGEKFVGYVDMGSAIQPDSLPEFREVIVFLINSQGKTTTPKRVHKFTEMYRNLHF